MAELGNTVVRSRGTATTVTCGTAGRYHKLSFTKFGDETWAGTDLNNGNIVFLRGDFRNVVFRCDFSIASITIPTGGNDRIEVGMAVVQLNV